MESRVSSWSDLKAKDIPATLELDPALHEYTFPGCRILDIGCGNGKVSINLASQDFSVTCADINMEVLKVASSLSGSKDLQQTPLFVRTDAINLPFPDAIFDIVIMQAFMTTIVSKEDRALVIREVCRVLKSQGHLYLSDFGQTWHSKIYRERYIRDLPLTKEEGSIIAYDRETGKVVFIAHHFTEKELVFLLIENGFELKLFKRDEFVTRTENKVNGFVVVGRKI